MARCPAIWSLLVLCTYASPATAARISLEPGDAALNPLDPLFQEAVIAAAPADWRETPGADVWRLSFDGVNVQVQVFPRLQHPGAGQPGCCFFLSFGDTEFRVKVRRVFPAGGRPPGGQPDDVTGAQPIGEGEQSSDDATITPPSEIDLPLLVGDAAPPADHVVESEVALAPEPGLLLLMGAGLGAAARRVRGARQRR